MHKRLLFFFFLLFLTAGLISQTKENLSQSTSTGTLTMSEAKKNIEDITELSQVAYTDANEKAPVIVGTSSYLYAIYEYKLGSSNRGIKIRISTNNGTSWNDWDLISNTTYNLGTPYAYITGSKLYIVWQVEYSTTDYDIEFCSYNVGGTPSGLSVTWVEQSGNNTFRPVVAVTSSDIYVGYVNGGTGKFQIRRSSNNGSTWSEIFTSSTNFVYPSTLLRADGTASGTNMFVFNTKISNVDQVVVLTRTGTSTWSETYVSSSSGNKSGPSIGTYGNNWIVAFQGTSSNVKYFYKSSSASTPTEYTLATSATFPTVEMTDSPSGFVVCTYVKNQKVYKVTSGVAQLPTWVSETALYTENIVPSSDDFIGLHPSGTNAGVVFANMFGVGDYDVYYAGLATSGGGDGNNDPTTATVISTIPHTAGYEINPAGDVDWYRVSLTANILYKFTSSSSSNFDSEFWLYGTGNSGGTSIGPLVANDDDGGGNAQPLIEYTPTSSGYYYLRIAYFGNNPSKSTDKEIKIKSIQETGPYTLMISTPTPSVVATPTFNPPSGTQQPVNVTINCETSGATVRYTLDGSDPTESSTTYTGPISLNGTSVVTLKAKAWKTGMTPSAVAPSNYPGATQQTVATPTFDPPTGTPQPVNVTISTTTSGATIRYTTDGTDPTESSPVYSSAIPFNSSTAATLKAKAWKVGMTPSSVAQANYPGIPGDIVWQHTITLSSGSDNGTLVIGQGVNATNGIDAQFGEAELPPVPPQGVFDIRMELPLSPIIYSLKDFRGSTLTSVTYTMQFQPGAGGYPINLSWNSASLPANGVFMLKDPFGGAIVNVNMKNQSSYSLTNTNVNKLVVEYSQGIQSTVNYSSGWNLLSVPVNASNMTRSAIFPSAELVYKYGTPYQSIPSSGLMENKIGYWVKFNSGGSVSLQGQMVTGNIPVVSGWNIIGPFHYSVPVSGITTNPAGILTTSFYGFNNGYPSATTLVPGKGYWIKASQAGNIILPPPTVDGSQGGGKEKDNPSAALHEISLTITDGAGGSQILKVGIDPSATDGLDPALGEQELPPMPPPGVFDARLNLPLTPVVSSVVDYRQGSSTGGFTRIFELHYQVGTGTQITVNYDFTPYSAGQLSGRLQDVILGTIVDVNISGVGSYTVTNSNIVKLKLTLTFGSPVPVELTSFTGTAVNGKVLLNWATATEMNNKGFEVERRAAGAAWQNIGYVQGNGTTTEPRQYSFTDASLTKDGDYEYRLKQVDHSGDFEYSKVISVNVSVTPENFVLYQNYPNPFNPSTQISYSLPTGSYVKLVLYDVIGNVAGYIYDGYQDAGHHSVNYDASHLTNGVYYYQITAGDFRAVKKLILMK